MAEAPQVGPRQTDPRADGLQYAYAVVRDTGTLDTALAGLRGVAGEPVRAVAHLGLAVVAGPVPAGEFDEEPLRERLEKLEWLERIARAHARVVDAAGADTGVVPVRLATVCRDEDGLRRMLETGRERFTEALDRLEGRVEWGVKVYAAPPPPAEPAAAPTTAVSGRDYLRRRRAERQASERRWGESEDGARLVHDALCAHAEQARLHPPQDARLSGEEDRNVLNAAYLVARADGPAFAERVEELARRSPGVRLELTGPWVPYSFVTPFAEDAERGRSGG
ncbi:GvpL/GvpF family gas vesicle protein [Streptomyces sp. NA02950]|uniref:GvpL/GvpF family gas vesicle protein n=1 Tax=Streptomyces sp. NA02950 TaxID=2742137 RepID=UPI0015908AAC|nr:GvpL/GvpF family gas vesicle protein [Streptomyces sp. NA02950]QKV95745.1 GvpL/GvpF family gas vesicle protein [Streptomyces sp. NA02950]